MDLHSTTASSDAPAAAAATAPRPAPPPIPPSHIAPRPPAISTRNLTKRYGALTALDDLTLELEAGDIFGFIGPNGAGKSTTMKILAGLLEPTSGEAAILGRPVASNGDFVRRHVGYMPDFIGVYEDLKVHEYLDFFAAAYGIPRAQRRRVVADVLEITDLKYKEGAFVDSLSRGMTQRLSLARVLVHDPPVLLLDEPASGLDPRARIEIREVLKELQRIGKTILVSSHILSELGEFCNKLGIIERGKLIVAGTIEDLMNRARAHPVIAVEVVGDADAAATVLRDDPQVQRVDRRNGQLFVTLHDPDLHHHFLVERLVARQIRVHSIHPEQLKLEDVFLRLTTGAVQ
jgi:ABC-2 type transport system ATP-binding protein